MTDRTLELLYGTPERRKDLAGVGTNHNVRPSWRQRAS